MIKQCLILFISNIIFWIQRIGARAYTNSFHCNKPGHWKRNCPVYLEELKKGSVTPSTSVIYVIEVNLSISTPWVLDTG